MSATVRLRATDEFPDGGGRMGTAAPGRGTSPALTGLWFFMLVATSLFGLFIVAYAMRMDSPDWQRLRTPWQLWLSTGWLVLGSVAMQGAVARFRQGGADAAWLPMLAGGVFAMLFLGSQLWAWQDLGHAFTSNAASSFFYVLTALHGLHVVGGLLGWVVATRGMRRAPAAHTVVRLRLCARYWHFLLVVWIVLFAALALLTPELVRLICGTG